MYVEGMETDQTNNALQACSIRRRGKPGRGNSSQNTVVLLTISSFYSDASVSAAIKNKSFPYRCVRGGCLTYQYYPDFRKTYSRYRRELTRLQIRGIQYEQK